MEALETSTSVCQSSLGGEAMRPTHGGGDGTGMSEESDRLSVVARGDLIEGVGDTGLEPAQGFAGFGAVMGPPGGEVAAVGDQLVDGRGLFVAEVELAQAVIGLAGQAGAGDAELRRLLGAREGRDVDVAERGVAERFHDALCLQAAGRGEGSRGTVEGVRPARLAVSNEEQSSRRRLRVHGAMVRGVRFPVLAGG